MSEEDNTETILPIDDDNKDEMKKRNTIEEVDTNIQISNEEEPQEKNYIDLDFLEYDSDDEEHSNHSNNNNNNSNDNQITTTVVSLKK